MLSKNFYLWLQYCVFTAANISLYWQIISIALMRKSQSMLQNFSICLYKAISDLDPSLQVSPSARMHWYIASLWELLKESYSSKAADSPQEPPQDGVRSTVRIIDGPVSRNEPPQDGVRSTVRILRRACLRRWILGVLRRRWKTEKQRAGGGGSRPGRRLGGVMKNMDHSPVRSQASTSSGCTGRRRNKKDSLNGRNVTDEFDVNSF